MNEKNLGVCFAPSLFHLCGTKEDPSSPKRQKRTPMNKASKELTDNLVCGLIIIPMFTFPHAKWPKYEKKIKHYKTSYQPKEVSNFHIFITATTSWKSFKGLGGKHCLQEICARLLIHSNLLVFAIWISEGGGGEGKLGNTVQPQLKLKYCKDPWIIMQVLFVTTGNFFEDSHK